MITNVSTTYTVTLDKPVIVTDEYHYDVDPTRSITRSAYEVTAATVVTRPGEEPHVELRGFLLLPSGARSKKHKGEAWWVPHVSILTQHTDESYTNDTSAYDGIVATVLAEVAASTHATIGA